MLMRVLEVSEGPVGVNIDRNDCYICIYIYIYMYIYIYVYIYLMLGV